MEDVNTLNHTLYEKGAEAFNSPCSQSQQSAEPRPITGCAPSPGAQGWWLLSQAQCGFLRKQCSGGVSSLSPSAVIPEGACG